MADFRCFLLLKCMISIVMEVCLNGTSILVIYIPLACLFVICSEACITESFSS
ncbi:hypothetical protein Patl1_02364 [Pistacia atlantica]|uniref:Uncharacterized protein n=2 Tax=Pistacia atlantica TaxID=434234 RepID=A0ACC1ACL7_9ROSI|nr:hypothetical protein Patl1_30296 [Pistacia atlantica]KAJ0111030.1 hypothetical protein Patl1_02364 [Pistacia atlantica]